MKFPSEIHMHVSFPSLQINFLFLSMDVIILKLYISQGGILSNGSVSWKHASKTLSTTSWASSLDMSLTHNIDFTARSLTHSCQKKKIIKTTTIEWYHFKLRVGVKVVILLYWSHRILMNFLATMQNSATKFSGYLKILLHYIFILNNPAVLSLPFVEV